ncbi:hypothetical protein HN865_05390 [Candidatus Woesearchaeota archaeon]|jgi:hypothetical protein|nr:hypothetical protein [Candidatus Woesearchaeota archaeon]MBT7238251.1 hypothetical protein [Candidatus Woesearchaeota archaeon]
MQKAKQKSIDDAFETNKLPRIAYHLKTDIYAATWPKLAKQTYINEAEELLKKHPNLNNPLYQDRIETLRNSL